VISGQPQGLLSLFVRIMSVCLPIAPACRMGTKGACQRGARIAFGYLLFNEVSHFLEMKNRIDVLNMNIFGHVHGDGSITENSLYPRFYK